MHNDSLHQIQHVALRWLLTTCIVFAPAVVFAKKATLEGHWTINPTETDKVRVPFKDDKANILSGTRMSGNVVIGGIPLPIPGGGGPRPNSPLAAKDPKVLRCTSMQIAPIAKKVRIDYDQVDKETIVKGDYRGRLTKMSSQKIEQKYKTPERTVTKTWTLRPDGRLLVSVVLNPKGERKRKFNRVFDRTEPPTLSDETSDTPASSSSSSSSSENAPGTATGST